MKDKEFQAQNLLASILTSGIGGKTSKVAFAPTTSSTAYTAEDNIGGIISLADLVDGKSHTGIIESISLWALNNAAPNLYIDFWDASPSGTYTNDAAQVIAGDQLKWMGMVEIATTDWKSTGVVARCSAKVIGLGIKAGTTDSTIYMTIQDKTGVTFGSAAGLFGYIVVLKD